jgi:hypothetical protein
MIFGFRACSQVKRKRCWGLIWWLSNIPSLSDFLIAAEGEVQNAEAFSRKFDTVIEEMDWMVEHAPEERAGQLVASELEQYASNQATTHQLTVKRRAILSNDESGTHFHRAKVEFNVNGMENSLYRWLGRLQMPDVGLHARHKQRVVGGAALAVDGGDGVNLDRVSQLDEVQRQEVGVPVPYVGRSSIHLGTGVASSVQQQFGRAVLGLHLAGDPVEAKHPQRSVLRPGGAGQRDRARQQRYGQRSRHHRLPLW